MTKKLIIPQQKKTTPRPITANDLSPKKTTNNSVVINNNVYGGSGLNPYGKKFKKRFKFFNPIMTVMIVTSMIVLAFGMLGGTKDSVAMGIGLSTLVMALQLYILFPAWIAFGRDCKHKEFILFTCIVFLGPLALIWALVGEKKEYDYPVD